MLDHPAHTAAEAAANQGCEVGQIVKSIVFERADDQSLVLVLVSGAHNAGMALLKAYFGCKLIPAKPDKIRQQTGFAIGGVSPIGHKFDIPTYMDRTLLDFETVWAAAGLPTTVFSVAPETLRQAANATVLDVKVQ